MQKGTATMFTAEVVGTAILIFIGCMGCIGTMGPYPPPPLQMALTFGLTVNLIIMASVKYIDVKISNDTNIEYFKEVQ